MIKEFKFYKFFYLYLVLLTTGPFLPDLLTVCLSIFFLIFCEKFFLKKFNYLKFFLIFYIFLIISSSFSEQILHSLKTSTTYFRFLFVIFAGYVLVQYEKNFLKKFNFSIMISLIIVFISLIIQKYQIFDLIPLNIESGSGRFTGPFGDDLKMGSFSLRMFMLLTFFTLINLSRKNEHIVLIFYLISAFLIINSGERTSFFLFIIFIFSFIFINKRLFFSMILIKLIILTLIIKHPSFSNYKSRLINKTISQTYTNKNIFSKYHKDHYKAGLEIFKDNLIIGGGPNSFRYECANYKHIDSGCSTHPHNIIVQFGSELGVFGLLFLIIFYSSLLFKLLTNSNKNMRLAIFIILINFFPFSPFGNFFNNYLSSFLFLSLVPYIVCKFKKNEN